MNKKNNLFLLLFGLFLFLSVEKAIAQIQPKIEYGAQPVIDTDLDGLTDQGEIQAYKTDPINVDTDGDSFYDGIEVLTGSNPIDQLSTPENVNSVPKQVEETGTVSNVSETKNETPWAWYISRSSGLVAFILLYISIFLVLIVRIPFFRKFLSPIYAMNAHGWIALQATIFALLHGIILTFDKFLSFSLKSVLIPFTSSYESLLIGFGTVGFYLMLLLVATSYLRKYMSFSVWRAIHFLNIGLYFIVIVHALYLGTDLKNDLARSIFIGANVILVALMLLNMFIKIRSNLIRKQKSAIANNEIDLIK